MTFARTQRRNLLLACLCIVSFAGLQCGRGDRRHADGSTITALFAGGDEWLLGPSEDEEPKFLVFLPLVTFNEKGQLEGRLARRWEHSDDYRTWTVHLRTDVTWHDGVPVTAHDIKFTLELLSHPDVAWLIREAFSITVLDDSTYTVTNNRTGHSQFDFSLTPADPWNVYYPKHLLEDLDPKDFFTWDFWTQPVGDGPYRYVSHVPKTMMEFEANPDYYRGKPKIERVVLKFGGGSLLTELLSGNTDVVIYADRMDLLKLADDARFRAYWDKDTWVFGAVVWNQRHEPLSDPKARLALTLAIDRREMHKVVNLPDGLPLFDGIFTERQYWRGQLPDPLPYNPALARRLLDEAGWHDVDGDGVRERDGAEFRFKAITPVSRLAESPLAAAAIYIQDQLRRVGVRMELRPLEKRVAYERLRAGEFEAAVQTVWIAPFGLQGWFGADSPFGYRNERVVELIEAAVETLDPDTIDAIYGELMRIFQDELPMTPLFPDIETHVAHRRIRGLSSPFQSHPLMFIEHLWVEDDD